MSSPPEEGDVHTYERTFTEEDVRRFGEVSGDRQAIHTEPDENGRLVVQGLLTATLPTKIGGDLSYLARTMEFDSLSPVYTGEHGSMRTDERVGVGTGRPLHGDEFSRVYE